MHLKRRRGGDRAGRRRRSRSATFVSGLRGGQAWARGDGRHDRQSPVTHSADTERSSCWRYRMTPRQSGDRAGRAAGGAVGSTATITRLLTGQEWVESLRKAQGSLSPASPLIPGRSPRSGISPALASKSRGPMRGCRVRCMPTFVLRLIAPRPNFAQIHDRRGAGDHESPCCPLGACTLNVATWWCSDRSSPTMRLVRHRGGRDR